MYRRIENLLVERIAVCYWRLRRAYRFEAQSIRHQRENEFGPYADVIRQFSCRKPDPHQYILPLENQLKLLTRYETMVDRQLTRNMTQLQQLQQARLGSPACPVYPEHAEGSAVEGAPDSSPPRQTKPSVTPSSPFSRRRRAPSKPTASPQDSGLQTQDFCPPAPKEPKTSPPACPERSRRASSLPPDSPRELTDDELPSEQETVRYLQDLCQRVAQDPRAVRRLTNVDNQPAAPNEAKHGQSGPPCSTDILRT